MASLTVIAIMSDDSADPFLYILGCVTSTLIWTAAATLTNIVVVRPRHEPVFRRELKELTNIFPELYVKSGWKLLPKVTATLRRKSCKVCKNMQRILRTWNVELDYLKASTGVPLRHLPGRC